MSDSMSGCIAKTSSESDVLRLAIYQIINENRQTMNRELCPSLNYLVNATFDCRGIFIE